MFAGFGGDLLPHCGSCGVELTESAPPYLWGLVQRGPNATLFGVCFKCSVGDTIACAVLPFFGAQPIEPANLHLLMRGRA